METTTQTATTVLLPHASEIEDYGRPSDYLTSPLGKWLLGVPGSLPESEEGPMLGSLFEDMIHDAVDALKELVTDNVAAAITDDYGYRVRIVPTWEQETYRRAAAIPTEDLVDLDDLSLESYYTNAWESLTDDEMDEIIADQITK